MDEPVAPRFEARLSGRSMRIMGAAVSYLGRVGKNILFEASPAGVAMMTLNDAQSTWACVDFNADFFDSYECVDVQQEPTSPLPRAESPARAFAQMFRSLKGVDSLRMRFTSEGAVGFLVARLEGNHSLTRDIAISYSEDNSWGRAVFNAPPDQLSTIIARPGQMAKLLDMLPDAVDQCALAALPHKLVLQSFSPTPPENNTLRGSLHTSLSLAPSDVDMFSMSPDAQSAVAKLLELVGGSGATDRAAQVAAAEAATSEVIFDCKPFKALVQFACDRAVESDEVCLQWYERAQPVYISTQGAKVRPFSASLVMATSHNSVLIPRSSSGGGAAAGAGDAIPGGCGTALVDAIVAAYGNADAGGGGGGGGFDARSTPLKPGVGAAPGLYHQQPPPPPPPQHEGEGGRFDAYAPVEGEDDAGAQYAAEMHDDEGEEGAPLQSASHSRGQAGAGGAAGGYAAGGQQQHSGSKRPLAADDTGRARRSGSHNEEGVAQQQRRVPASTGHAGGVASVDALAAAMGYGDAHDEEPRPQQQQQQQRRDASGRAHVPAGGNAGALASVHGGSARGLNAIGDRAAGGGGGGSAYAAAMASAISSRGGRPQAVVTVSQSSSDRDDERDAAAAAAAAGGGAASAAGGRGASRAPPPPPPRGAAATHFGHDVRDSQLGALLEADVAASAEMRRVFCDDGDGDEYDDGGGGGGGAAQQQGRQPSGDNFVNPNDTRGASLAADVQRRAPARWPADAAAGEQAAGAGGPSRYDPRRDSGQFAGTRRPTAAAAAAASGMSGMMSVGRTPHDPQQPHGAGAGMAVSVGLTQRQRARAPAASPAAAAAASAAAAAATSSREISLTGCEGLPASPEY